MQSLSRVVEQTCCLICIKENKTYVLVWSMCLTYETGFRSQIMSSTVDMLSARVQWISWKTLALKWFTDMRYVTSSPGYTVACLVEYHQVLNMYCFLCWKIFPRFLQPLTDLGLCPTDLLNDVFVVWTCWWLIMISFIKIPRFSLFRRYKGDRQTDARGQARLLNASIAGAYR